MIERARRVRGQSRAANVHRALRLLAALTRGRLRVEFADIGGEGACYDVDTEDEYEAVSAVCARPAGRGTASVNA